MRRTARVLTLVVVTLAILTLAGAAGAQVTGLYYKEVAKDGRIYVFNTPEAYQRWSESGEMGVAISLVGRGPNRETVVAENETALELFVFKHGLEPYERETPKPKEPEGWIAEWSNGHKIESRDKKFALKFGGRIQADYTFASADDALAADTEGDGFEFRRARLFFEGTIYERVKFKAEYDFAGGDAAFKDVWMGLKNDWGEVRFGHYKEYFSLEELTSSNYLAFLERSMPVEAFAPSRNSGVGVHGSSGDRLNWGVGAFYDADDFAISTDEDDVNVTARVGFRPLYEDKGQRMIHVGVAATNKDRASTIRFRARPEAHFSGRFVDTGNFPADSALVLGGEVAGVFDRLWFAGEYLTADVDAPAAGDPSFDGAYLQAGYYLTPDHRHFKPGDGAFDRQKPASTWGKNGGTGAWEVAARISTIDLTDEGIAGGEQDDITLGVNWYPNPATRLMINWVNADVDGVGEADFFLLRWQVDF